MSTEFSRGKHPNSLANVGKGRSTSYSEPKQRRHLSVTQTGWDIAKNKIKTEFGLSVSELIEQIGRDKIDIIIKS